MNNTMPNCHSTEPDEMANAASANGLSDSSSSDENDEAPEDFRNPSPPLEFLEAGALGEGDTISGTAVSERWVLQTLIKLSNAVEDANKDSFASANQDVNHVCELDGDLEANLCQLWDISVEKEVVSFLLTVPTLNIFTDALSCRTLPRLTEIVAGIAGNMACIAEACQVLCRNEAFCQALQATFDSNDPPTLVKLLRAHLAFLQNECSARSCFARIENNQNLLSRLTFITSSSTNGALLNAVANFVDFALETSENLRALWVTKDFVTAVLEAIQQIGYNEDKVIDTYYNILHSLCTSEKGKESIVGLHEAVIESISSYFKHSLEPEEDLVDVEGRSVGFTSTLFIVQMLLNTNPCKMVQSLKEGFIRSILKLLNANHVQESLEPVDNFLEEALTSITEEILSSEEGKKAFLYTLNDCEEVHILYSLQCLRKLSNGKHLFAGLYSAAICSQPDLDRLSNVFKQFQV